MSSSIGASISRAALSVLQATFVLEERMRGLAVVPTTRWWDFSRYPLCKKTLEIDIICFFLFVQKVGVVARARAQTQASHSSSTPPSLDTILVDSSSISASAGTSGARYGTRAARRQEAVASVAKPSRSPTPEAETYFARAPVFGVTPPVVAPGGVASLDGTYVIGSFQERIGRALSLDPPRAKDWSYACLKKTGFAAVPAGPLPPDHPSRTPQQYPSAPAQAYQGQPQAPLPGSGHRTAAAAPGAP